MTNLEPCPICGAKAVILHYVVDDTFDMGYSAGCPRFCLNDGIHGIGPDDPEDAHPSVNYWNRAGCIKLWNQRAKRLKEGEI